MTQILDPVLQGLRNKLDEAIKDLHNMATRIDNESLSMTISDLRNRITEPFMFVIVGEVKAGKSSFVNALLESDQEICKTGPMPVTDTIQQILYGDEQRTVEVNKYLKKIYQPAEILREIAIVDTPGTNTIIKEHQQVTERFIPASDLIVFVFEAKNPYRQSAWEFFDYIHGEWQKKIIFVLQQKDLMNAGDLEINMKGVQAEAEKRGLELPRVFATSAKMEQEGQGTESGFTAVRTYIRDNVTGGKAPWLKLGNNLTTSLNLHEKITAGLHDRRAQYEADMAFRADVTKTLENQAQKSAYQVRTLVESLMGTYDKNTTKTERELQSGLSFFSLIKRSVSSIFSKKSSAKEWLEKIIADLEIDLNRDLQSKLNEGVTDLADSIRQMAKMIDLKIKSNKTILTSDHEIFSDIADRRSQVIHDLESAFGKFMTRSESFRDEDLFSGSDAIAPSVATGSGIAVIGIILTTLTQGVVFDITGGVLTTIGILFAGITTGTQKRKIIRQYRAEVAKGRTQLEHEVGDKLNAYVRHIRSRIENNFTDFDALLKKEGEQLNTFEQQHADIRERLQTISKEVKQELAENS